MIRRRAKTPIFLTVAALGVVFGDIGTSPLYTLKLCLGLAGSKGGLADVLGICSLLFWALVVVVCIKYATFITRVDHEGEGGILARADALDGDLLAALAASGDDDPLARADAATCVSKRGPPRVARANAAS